MSSKSKVVELFPESRTSIPDTKLKYIFHHTHSRTHHTQSLTHNLHDISQIQLQCVFHPQQLLRQRSEEYPSVVGVD